MAMLRRRLLVAYILLVGVVIVANVALIMEVTGEATTKNSHRSGEPVTAQGFKNLFSRLWGSSPAMSWAAVVFLSLTISIVGCGYSFYLLVAKILKPLDTITGAAREISEGNLSVAVPSHGKDEMAGLSRTMNDIAANYQEVLLFMGAKVGNVRSVLRKIEKDLEGGKNPDSGRVLRDQLEIMERELASLSEVVQQYRFYKARFNGSKIVRN